MIMILGMILGTHPDFRDMILGTHPKIILISILKIPSFLLILGTHPKISLISFLKIPSFLLKFQKSQIFPYILYHTHFLKKKLAVLVFFY